jgi:hypothetical protein
MVCKFNTDGENRWWSEGKWYTINKKGTVLQN